MVRPKRIQRRRTKGWRMPEGAVNICRPGPWGNPWRVGDILFNGLRVEDAAHAVRLFEANTMTLEYEERAREELAGKDLVCWCRDGEPCHGHPLLAVAN